MKSILSKLFPTMGTEKVFRVPICLQSCHAFIQNRTIAVCTAWGVQFVVIILTVGLTLSFVKVLRAQFLTTMIACKMFRVPCFS
jgi:hypothetical protein